MDALTELTLRMLSQKGNDIEYVKKVLYEKYPNVWDRVSLAKSPDLEVCGKPCVEALIMDRSKRVREALSSRTDLNKFCDKDCYLKFVTDKDDVVRYNIALDEHLGDVCGEDCLVILSADEDDTVKEALLDREDLADKCGETCFTLLSATKDNPQLQMGILDYPDIEKYCSIECFENLINSEWADVRMEVVKSPLFTEYCDEECCVTIVEEDEDYTRAMGLLMRGDIDTLYGGICKEMIDRRWGKKIKKVKR